MSPLKDHLGLDAFDLLIHVGVTASVMGFMVATMPFVDRQAALPLAAGASLVVLGIRRSIALRKRPNRGLTTGEMAAARLEELESRMEQLEAAQARVAELEERVEFAERLLAQTSSEHKLQAGGPA